MSKFSDFIRNATPEEKEAVYDDVMKRATERQWKGVTLGPDDELRQCPHCKNVASWKKWWHPDECPSCLRYISTGKKV